MQNPSRLTPREIEVLKLIASGHSSKQLAGLLGISFKTASCHRSRLMEKLGIHEVAGLTRYAIRNGYIDAQENGIKPATQAELGERVRQTYAKFRGALEEYDKFLRDRATFEPGNPDGITGSHRLRMAEHAAHQEYHQALVALKKFLLPG